MELRPLGYDELYPDGNDGTAVSIDKATVAESLRSGVATHDASGGDRKQRLVDAPGKPMPNARRFVADRYSPPSTNDSFITEVRSSTGMAPVGRSATTSVAHGHVPVLRRRPVPRPERRVEAVSADDAQGRRSCRCAARGRTPADGDDGAR